MKILVERFRDNGEATLSRVYIDGVFECYGLEDEEREVKVMGETRVPEGEYPVKLRKEGGHHERYLKKYGVDFHRGMLCISNAPNWKLVSNGMEFQYILIHIGNDDGDTAGCLLVGEDIESDNFIVRSSSAYYSLYKKVSKALVSGEYVSIEYIKNYENV